jgi:hypothetical protein
MSNKRKEVENSLVPILITYANGKQKRAYLHPTTPPRTVTLVPDDSIGSNLGWTKRWAEHTAVEE